jgi:hypothetical protein
VPDQDNAVERQRIKKVFEVSREFLDAIAVGGVRIAVAALRGGDRTDRAGQIGEDGCIRPARIGDAVKEHDRR